MNTSPFPRAAAVRRGADPERAQTPACVPVREDVLARAGADPDRAQVGVRVAFPAAALAPALYDGVLYDEALFDGS